MKKSIIMILIFLSNLSIYAGYYFRDDFDTLSSSIWHKDLQMGREGIALPAYSTVISAVGGLLQLGNEGGGTPNGNTAGRYDGAWCGAMVICSNKKFSATASNPFGVETSITRWRMVNGAPGGSIQKTCEIGLWLIQDLKARTSLYTNEGDNFENKAILFHIYEDYAAAPKSFWGVYVNGTEFRFDLNNAKRADGITTVNISGLNGITSLGTTIITNIKVRMINDGNKLYCFINPDPQNKNPYPNEFCLVGSYDITWNNNLRFALAQEVRYKNAFADFRSDYILVKSTAESSIPTMTKGSTVSASTNPNDKREFELTIQNNITPTNSGINVIKVIKPSSFGKWATSNLTNEIKVFTAYDGGATLKSNVVRSFSAYSNLNTNQCSVRTNGNELWIRLGKQITSSFANKNILIKFNITTSSNEGYYYFYTYTDGVLFDPVINNQTNYSTCGPIKGETIVEVVSGSRTPYAFGAIEDDDGDNIVLSGLPSYTFTFNIETIGVTNSDADNIQKVYIKVPEGIVVSSAGSMVLIDNNSACVSFVTNPSEISTNGVFIKINYSLDTPPKKIARIDGIDIIKIVVSQITQIGTLNWEAWAVGEMGKITKILTNSYNPSQKITVIGANPKARIGIYEPSSGNPRILFNTIKSNRIKIEIENQASDPANKIYAAIIYIPSFFTNIKNISSSIIANQNNIKFYKAPIGNKSSITLFYANEGKSIIPSQSDIITFDTWHSIPPNSGSTTNEYFSATVNNSNGMGYIPASTVGKVTNIMITDPIPSGAAHILPQDGYVYTSDVTNVFNYKIVNVAPAGSSIDILFFEISIPTNYFSSVKNISSLILGTSGITNYNNSKIRLNYASQSKKIQPGEIDTITFTLVDKYTNFAVPANVLISSKVANYTKTNETIDYAPYDRKIYFIPQEARARCWTVNKNFLSENSSFTLYYAISNYGDPGNRIKQARLYFTNTLINIAIGNVSSSIVSPSDISYLAGPVINIDYSTANFNSGMKDVITIKGEYLALNVENTYDIECRVTVNTSVLVPARIKTNDNIYIYFEIPKPYADVHILPNIVFTSSIPEVNYLTYYITNKGTGGNNIIRAEILIPAIYQGKVTAVTSSHIINESAGITNKIDKIVLSYISDNSNYLSPGEKDIIKLALTNSITFITNVSFNCRIYNFNKTNYGTEKQGKSKIVSVVEQSKIEVTPNSNYTTDITNTYRIKIANGETLNKGRNIYWARININTNVFTTNYIYPYDLYPGAVASTVKSNNKVYLYINYTANPLPPGYIDDFYLKLVDKVIVTNTVKWEIEVDYNDGYGFRGTKPMSEGSDILRFVMPKVEATASITPNQIAVNNLITPMTYTINNTGKVGNDILLVRIRIPEFESIFTNVDITSVSNLKGGEISFGYSNSRISSIIVNYAKSGVKIQSGEYDRIYFSVYDSVTSGGPTKYQFKCDAANTTNFNSPTTLTNVPESILDAQKVQFSEANYQAYAYITSHSPQKPIDTTITTNTIVYYIYNNSLTESDKINVVKISIPTNYFITNGLEVKSSYSNAVITKGADFIMIDYASANPPTYIPKNSSDTITIRIIDKVYIGDIENVEIPIYALFSTSVPNYIRCVEPGGNQLQRVNFKMPEAKADAYITPNAVLTVNADNKYVLKVINKGSGSNKIYRVVVFVDNSIITNIYGVDSSLISEDTNNVRPKGIYTKNPYEGLNVTSFTLNYHKAGISLNPGKTDTIIFRGIDNYINNSIDTNIRFEVFVANESNENSTNYYKVSIPTGYRLDVDFKHFPGYPYANNNTEAGFVDDEPTYQGSMNLVGNYIYRIKNNAFGSNNIVWAVIGIPSDTFTNIKNIQSTKIGSGYIKTGVSTITLYYGRAGTVIKPGEYDDISFIGTHNIGSNLKTDVTKDFPSWTKFQTNGTEVKTANLNGIPLVQSVVIKRVRKDKALSYIDKLVRNIEGYKAEVTITTEAVLYSIDTNVKVKYKIVNQSAEDDIKIVKLIFDINLDSSWFKVETSQISSLKSSNIILGSNTIEIDYSGNYIKSINGSEKEEDRIDIIEIPIWYKIEKETNISIKAKYGLAPAGTADEDTVSEGKPQELKFRFVNFGRIIGKVYPGNVTFSAQVLDRNGNEVKSVFGEVVPMIYNDTNGVYILDYVPEGVWDIKLTSGNLTGTSKGIRVQKGDNITFKENKELEIDLKYIVQKEKKSYQRIGCYDSGYENTYLLVPTGDAVIENFAFNIRVNKLSDKERKAISEGKSGVIKTEYSKTGNLEGFDLDVEDLEGVDYKSGIELSSECILVLEYKEPLPEGWKEKDLAVFYWDDRVGKWYRLGGVVDEVNNSISVNIRYLHRRYAVLAGVRNEKNLMIYGVEVNNNPFTPKANDPEYNHTIIGYQLREPAGEVELVIYNMRGEEIIRYKLDGSKLNGQQSWDGKDKNGNLVPGGIYIFQIIANKKDVYTGSIILIK